MAVGLNGDPGQAVVTHVVVDHKHACALAPIHLPLGVVQTVKVVIPSPNPATRMDAQVRFTNKYTAKDKCSVQSSDLYQFWSYRFDIVGTPPKF